MYVEWELSDLLTVVNVLILLYLIWKGIKMSAGSNLKDAVVSLQNSVTALNAAVTTHNTNVAGLGLTPDADVQSAADAINAVAISLTQTAGTLK